MDAQIEQGLDFKSMVQEVKYFMDMMNCDGEGRVDPMTVLLCIGRKVSQPRDFEWYMASEGYREGILNALRYRIQRGKRRIYKDLTNIIREDIRIEDYPELVKDGTVRSVLTKVIKDYMTEHPDFTYTNYMKGDYVADLTLIMEQQLLPHSKFPLIEPDTC